MGSPVYYLIPCLPAEMFLPLLRLGSGGLSEVLASLNHLSNLLSCLFFLSLSVAQTLSSGWP